MEPLPLILFLVMTGCAAVLTVLAVLDWFQADRIRSPMMTKETKLAVILAVVIYIVLPTTWWLTR